LARGITGANPFGDGIGVPRPCRWQCAFKERNTKRQRLSLDCRLLFADVFGELAVSALVQWRQCAASVIESYLLKFFWGELNSIYETNFSSTRNM
jgi:hypothetical protein